MMEYVYFFKKEGENVPIKCGSSEDYRFLLLTNTKIEQITNRFPESKNNLFALVEGTEFKVGSSVLKLN